MSGKYSQISDCYWRVFYTLTIRAHPWEIMTDTHSCTCWEIMTDKPIGSCLCLSLFFFFWWVLQHCTGFARLVWGRIRVHPSFHSFKSICVFCVFLFSAYLSYTHTCKHTHKHTHCLSLSHTHAPSCMWPISFWRWIVCLSISLSLSHTHAHINKHTLSLANTHEYTLMYFANFFLALVCFSL